MELFDFQVAGLVLALATAMVKVWESLKDRLGERWTGSSDLTRELAGYGMMAVTGLIVLATGLDMAPGLNAALPWVGRAFTCVVGAIASSSSIALCSFLTLPPIILGTIALVKP